jgi:hypothetical protein
VVLTEEHERSMDILFIGLMVVFFAGTLGLVRLCEKV